MKWNVSAGDSALGRLPYAEQQMKYSSAFAMGGPVWPWGNLTPPPPSLSNSIDVCLNAHTHTPDEQQQQKKKKKK